jgi:hypothetical protein
MTRTDEQPTKPKRIWLWALIAGWIAAILATLGSVGAYIGAPAPDGTPEGASALVAYMLGFCAAAAVLAAVITWAIFAMTVFLRRGSIAKALIVLAVMIPAAFAVATPISFIAMLGHSAQRDEDIDRWNRETAQRLQLLAQTLDRQVTENGDVSLDHLQRPSDVDEILERNRRILALYEAYKLQLEQDLTAARQRVTGLNLTDREQHALLEQSEQRAFANLREAAGLNLEAARHRLNMTTLLHDEPTKWTIQDGRVAFYDRALMQNMQSLAREHDAIIARLNELQPTPSASTPPRPR